MAKQLGRGTKIYWGDTTGATNFVAIPQVSSVGEIRKTSPRVAVTDLDSTAEEYLGGLPDPQTIAVQALWDPLNANHQQMDTDQRNATVRYFKVEVYRGTPLTLIRTGTFQGYVSEFASGPFENQNPVNMPMVIQLSGDITWT